MSDALPLPPRPNLEHYRNRAKDLVRICKSGDRDALGAWVAEWIEKLVKLYALDVDLPRDGHRAYTPAEIRRRTGRSVERLAKHLGQSDTPASCTLTRAQFALAREHGFESWPRFTKHLEAMARAHPPISTFESAVDAIVAGDLTRLEKLLKANPDLVGARSTREHRSTLLHYVSANGVEDFRQKTPKNIVQVTRLLLDAGADVNAESDAYGGRSTTLGLTATSCHPENAGVQRPLMELLIDRGAAIDGPDGASAVNACLHNGRGAAAKFLAGRGARLDLEGAAGVGQLDVVQGFLRVDGTPRPPATEKQLKAGFAWACEFGRTEVVGFLLQNSLAAGATLSDDGGETGLHWAAYEGHADVVGFLLDRGAPVERKDKRHHGTPLDWALYGWGNSRARADRVGYYETVALLARAGAIPNPQWYEDDDDRRRAARRMRSDPRMLAALRGELPR